MGNNFFGRSKSKFKNRFVRIDGHLFHSQKEAKWWLFLKHRQDNKEICGLERQVRYEIYRTKEGKPRYYIADFVFQDEAGEHIVDVKSNFTAKDPVFKIKRELFECKYQKQLEIWTGSPPKNFKAVLPTGPDDSPEPPNETPKPSSSKKSRSKKLPKNSQE